MPLGRCSSKRSCTAVDFAELVAAPHPCVSSDWCAFARPSSKTCDRAAAPTPLSPAGPRKLLVVPFRSCDQVRSGIRNRCIFRRSHSGEAVPEGNNLFSRSNPAGAHRPVTRLPGSAHSRARPNAGWLRYRLWQRHESRRHYSNLYAIFIAARTSSIVAWATALPLRVPSLTIS